MTCIKEEGAVFLEKQKAMKKEIIIQDEEIG